MSYGTEKIRNLYFKSPLFLKNVFSSVYGIQQRWNRYGKIYHHHLRFLRETQYWDNNKLLDFQKGQVIDFINRTIQNVSFYQQNFDVEEIDHLEEIKKLPLIDKVTLRNYVKDFYKLGGKRHQWAHTSGTTGSALVFPLTHECFQKEYAFRGLHYEWGGVGLHSHDKIAICAGHPVTYFDRSIPPFWVYDWINNWIYFSSYHLAENNLKHYIRELEKFQPLMIHGYPSSIYLLANAYEKYGRGSLKLKSIYTSSETLLDFQRNKIENSFQAKVFNWYGTSEMSANIVECERGELHLKPEHSYVEILNNRDEPSKPGEKGRIVSTNFANSAFPIVRYDIGDEVKISKNQISKCGRGGLLIDEISGRNEDYIYTPDGRMIGRLDHIFKDSLNIVEAQIEQNRINLITLRVVRAPTYSAKDEKAIKKEAVLRLGNSIKIEFEYVNEIARTKNGKFRFILSKIDRSVLNKFAFIQS